ncbi:alpha-L-rhamnosidase-related protein [Mangrovibacterium lignilyticum]|uniref:alpha-L-rhamnosidase-related protein n=1 Tax=Mangrovibacterium lignilyticum TaxID=2668052 RepID=UPI0013D7C280|nr:alpha-L-rhamnosidase C-terminal domain-containing protein [Mangrovibacterium lignilyticum]
MNKLILLISLIILSVTSATAQIPPVFNQQDSLRIRKSKLSQLYISPKRIVWTSDPSGRKVKNANSLINPGVGQADLNRGDFLMLANRGVETEQGLIIDFGREIQGGIEIVTTISNSSPAGRIRISLGESVSETMSEVGVDGATNDHAIRDFVITIPRLGRTVVGESGFRFVHINLVDPNTRIQIKEVNAVMSYRDIPYKGSFTCSDDRLNEIWMTGAYTVHLNMQNYLWDGIKRDRLVWVGDMHPEVMTINSVFGYNEVVPKSLDFVRNGTPLPKWMNNISSYSLWWILIQRDWYYYQGNLEYLKEQEDYLVGLLKQLTHNVDENGVEQMEAERFLDWPSSENKQAIHAGLQSLMLMSFKAGQQLCKALGNTEIEKLCAEYAAKLKQHVPEMADSKQAAALLAISGLVSPSKANREILSQDGVHKMSTFYGYYMLIARAMAGDYQGAIDNIREYWGGMLDLGATTFWEDFDIDWMKNAARIDELVPEGKIDVHKTYGGYCYKQFRHSFCHGWASGPTAWLTTYVLGVNVVEPGCKTIRISPHLGDLQWVKGSFPTPYGDLYIKHHKTANGEVKTTYKKPKGIKVIIDKQ